MSDSNKGRHFTSSKSSPAAAAPSPKKTGVPAAKLGVSTSDLSDTAAFLSVGYASALAPSETYTASTNASAATDGSYASGAVATKPLVETPQSTAPANPLVAARAAGGRSESAAATSGDDLYPVGSSAPKGHKEFDTSFGSTKRNHGRTLLIVLVVIVALVIVGAVVFFVYRGNVQSKADENIAQAVASIETADTVIDPLSESIGEEISTLTVSDGVTNAMMTSTTASNALTEASTVLEETNASRALLTDEQVSAIDAARNAVSARRSMLDVGRSLLTTDSSMSAALDSLQGIYTAINDANTQVQTRDAAWNLYREAPDGETNGVDLWANVELDNAALNNITNAQAALEQVKAGYTDGDYAALTSYLEAQAAALTLLVQYDTAYATDGMDTDDNTALLDQYNAAAATAAEASTSLPAEAGTVLSSIYSVAIDGQKDAYESARSAIEEADTYLASYSSSSAE